MKQVIASFCLLGFPFIAHALPLPAVDISAPGCVAHVTMTTPLKHPLKVID